MLSYSLQITGISTNAHVSYYNLWEKKKKKIKKKNKVPHARLFNKLVYYGIRGPYLDWIKEFLANRTQQVVIDNMFSTPSPVVSGVPQGSVLGPLLFLLFINDLPSNINSTMKLYADDVLMFRGIQSSSNQQMLQRDIDKLTQWSATW